MSVLSNARNLVINGGIFQSTETIGKAKSGFDRLQSSIASGAFHNSSERYDAPKCHPNTRKAVLSRITTWTESSKSSDRIMWLNGPAGAGKSSIIQTIAEICHDAGRLAASFFFSRMSPGRDTGEYLASTIAYQLCLYLTELRPFIEKEVEQDPAIFSRNLKTQFKFLITDPVLAYVAKHGRIGTLRPNIIVIDGLDECQDTEVQTDIICSISASLQLLHQQFYVIIASRPEYSIRKAFDFDVPKPLYTSVVLDDSLNPDADIRLFLESSFYIIQQQHSLRQYIPECWPSENVIEILVRRSSGQFIYASTVMKYIEDHHHNPKKRLDVILGLTPTSDGERPFSQLDLLYSHILSSATNTHLMMRILGALLFIDWGDMRTLVSMPKTTECLDRFLGLDMGDCYLCLSDLYSLLYITKRDEKSPFRSCAIQILHASLPDFLLDRSRSGKFFLEKGEINEDLARCCLREIRSAFKRENAKTLNSPWNDRIRSYSLIQFFYHCAASNGSDALMQGLANIDATSMISSALTEEQTLLKRIPNVFPSVKIVISTSMAVLKTRARGRVYVNDLLRRFQFALEQHHIEALNAFKLQGDELLIYLAIVTGAAANECGCILDINLVLLSEEILHLDRLCKHGSEYRKWLAQFLSTRRAGKYFLTEKIHAQSALSILKYIYFLLNPTTTAANDLKRIIKSCTTALMAHLLKAAYLNELAGTLQDPRLNLIHDLLNKYGFYEGKQTYLLKFAKYLPSIKHPPHAMSASQKVPSRAQPTGMSQSSREVSLDQVTRTGSLRSSSIQRPTAPSSSRIIPTILLPTRSTKTSSSSSMSSSNATRAGVTPINSIIKTKPTSPSPPSTESRPRKPLTNTIASSSSFLTRSSASRPVASGVITHSIAKAKQTSPSKVPTTSAATRTISTSSSPKQSHLLVSNSGEVVEKTPVSAVTPIEPLSANGVVETLNFDFTSEDDEDNPEGSNGDHVTHLRPLEYIPPLVYSYARGLPSSSAGTPVQGQDMALPPGFVPVTIANSEDDVSTLLYPSGMAFKLPAAGANYLRGQQ